MSVCLALADALNEFHPGFMVKWPNDILFDKKKICGVLIENSVNANRLQNSIVGVGLNVNQREFTLPMATSLALVTGRLQDLKHVLNRVLENFENRYLQVTGNPRLLKEEYLQALYGVHHPVKVNFEGKTVEALLLDVKNDGELLLRAEGRLHAFRFKEVEFLL